MFWAVVASIGFAIFDGPAINSYVISPNEMSLKKVTIGIADAVTSIVHPCFSALPGEFIQKKKNMSKRLWTKKLAKLGLKTPLKN